MSEHAPARIRYILPEIGTNELADRIRARRGGKDLIDLDGILLHAPPVAEGWNALGAAIRSKSTLSLAIVELLICRVAVLNGAAYVWHEHAPIAIREGISPKTMHTIRTAAAFSFSLSPPSSVATSTTASTAFDLPEPHAALLDYADYMTRVIKVPKTVFARVKDAIATLCADGSDDEKQKDLERKLVEVTNTVAGYNMVTRMIMAMDVGGMEGEEVPIPDIA